MTNSIKRGPISFDWTEPSSPEVLTVISGPTGDNSQNFILDRWVNEPQGEWAPEPTYENDFYQWKRKLQAEGIDIDEVLNTYFAKQAA